MTLAYGDTPRPPSMRGPDGPRDRLARHLIDVAPRKANLLREAWGLGQSELPNIGKVSSGELPENVVSNQADAWIEVINPRMLPGLRRVDISPQGDPVYQVRYSCRIYVWCIGLDWDMSMARRDNVTALVKLALLEFPTLTSKGGDTGFLVLEETWSEEYGYPARTPNQSGRCWCSANLSVDVRAEEIMDAGRMRVPIGTNLSTMLAVDPVGAPAPIPGDIPRPDGWNGGLVGNPITNVVTSTGSTNGASGTTTGGPP